MMNVPIYLTEDDVRRLVTVKDALAALEECFAHWHDGATANIDRRRAPIGAGNFNLMGATYGHKSVYGLKAYFAGRSGARYHVLLYAAEDARLLAMIEANLLGALRTGAASGVATRLMAKRDAATLAVIGAGHQAVHQVAAIVAVRPIKSVRVYARTPESRAAFAQAIAKEFAIEATAATDAAHCVDGADIVVTITKSAEPVCRGAWLAEGVHVNAAGANAAERRELDAETVLKAQRVVTDARSQAQVEAGEFRDLAAAGRLDWANVHELGDFASGKLAGRRTDREITLFKSLGIALEDVAFAELVYRHALAAGIGKAI
jgi:ornithine cyclodeaminase/alanine dehydrogenase-like protein (mu-crystallin family)